MYNENRNFYIIKNVINELHLDLSDQVVLTEAGSGLFLYTPIICLMAKAKLVYAIIKDSTYGTADQIEQDLLKCIEDLYINRSALVIMKNEISSTSIVDATIITNSGNVRPINEHMLLLNNHKAVIPVMYEKWELRESDIDIEYCKKHNIKVAGTWENYPGLDIFNYCKHLMIKMIFEAGMEIKKNKIIIWGDDKYGPLLQDGVNSLECESCNIVNSTDALYLIKDADILFFCDYTSTKNLIGDKGIINIELVKQNNPNLTIIHLAGNIDYEYSKKFLHTFPNKNGNAKKMTYTLNHLGSYPTLALNVAGLKVGELLVKNETNHKLVQLI